MTLRGVFLELFSFSLGGGNYLDFLCVEEGCNLNSKLSIMHIYGKLHFHGGAIDYDGVNAAFAMPTRPEILMQTAIHFLYVLTCLSFALEVG